MKKAMTLLTLLAAVGLWSIPAPAAVIVDVDFSMWAAKIGDADGADDADRVEDRSGNGYHGFWGQTASNVPVVATPGGTGVDNTAKTGKVFLRDQLTGIPAGWDGPTTTRTPYFTLNGDGSFTLEAVVNWNTTASNRNGLMGRASTGSQAWLRESGGYLHYAFGVENTKDANLFTNTIDVRTEKADGAYHHIGLVYDGLNGQIRTYVDYQLENTHIDAAIGDLGLLLNPLEDIYLGAYNTTAGDQFNGIQDRYRISDTALAPADFVAIPEPSTLALLLGALGLTLGLRRIRH